MARDAEITLDLNLKEFIDKLKTVGPELQKALNVDADIPGVKEYRQELEKSADITKHISKETGKLTGAYNPKNLEKWSEELKDIISTSDKLGAVKARLKELGATDGDNSGKENAEEIVSLLEQQKNLTAVYKTQYKELSATQRQHLRDIVNAGQALDTNRQSIDGINNAYKETLSSTQEQSKIIGEENQQSEQLAETERKVAENAQQAAGAMQETAQATGELNAETQRSDVDKSMEETAKSAGKTHTVLEELVEQANDFNQRFAELDKNNIIEIVKLLDEAKRIYAGFKAEKFPTDASAEAAKVRDNMVILQSLQSKYDQNLKRVNSTTATTSATTRKLSVDARNAGEEGKNAANKAEKATRKASSALSSISKAVGVIKKGFSVVNKLTGRTEHSFSDMARSMRSNFKHMITSMTKYVLGFRSLFFLVRRLRKYIGEGIENMAKFNDGNNHVNEGITNLLSSLLFLKNAWATAFSPIIQFVQGWLDVLIDKLAEVGNAFSRFLGVLLGQEIVFQAVKVDAADYADSLDNVGGSAGSAADKTKKLTDRLAAFDDLNVLGVDNDPDGTGSGGGGGSADAYTPDVNDMFKLIDVAGGLGQKIRDAIANGMDFTDIGRDISSRIVGMLTSINWNEIQQKAEGIGKGIRTFFTGLFSDPNLWNSVGHTIAEGLNTVTMFIGSLLTDEETLLSKMSPGTSTSFGRGLAMLINVFFHDVDWDLINENILNFVTTFRDNVLDFLREINWDQIQDVARGFGETLAKSINETLGDSKFMGRLGTTFAETINTLYAGFNQFFDELDPEEIGEAIANFFSKALTNIKWGEVGHSISASATAIINAISKAMEETPDTEITNAITDFFDGIDWDDLFGAIARSISASTTSATKITVAITNAVNEIVTSKEFGDTMTDIFTAIFDNLDIAALVDCITQVTLAVFDTIAAQDDLLGNIIKGLVTGLANHIKGMSEEDWWELANALADLVGGPILAGIKNGVKKGFDEEGGVLEWVKMLFFGPIVMAFDELFEIGSPSKVMEEKGGYLTEGLKNGIDALMPDVEQIYTDFKKWLEDTWYNIRTTAVSNFWTMKTKIVEAFDAIKEGVKSPINGLIGIVEGMVNAIIDGINSMLDKLNSMPDFTVTNPFNGNTYTLGVDLPNLNHVSIPRLAQGAVIPPNREFMAVLGDQSHGTNIEAPLDTIKQAVAEVLANNGNAEMIQLLQQLITVVESKNLIIGDKDIGRANARYTQQQNRIRGVGF